MKTKFVILVTLITAFLLAACSAATPTPQYMPDGPEKDAVLADTDSYIQDIVTGIETNDYAVFTKNFDDTLLSAMKESDFSQLAKTFGPLGKPESIELKNVEIAGEYFAVRYMVTYTEKVLVYRVVVNNSNPRKISGLWFD